MKNLPDRIYVSMEGGDCILAVKPSNSPDFTGADYDFIDKQLFPLEEGECVEYVRKDSFVEKAHEFLNKHIKEVVRYEVSTKEYEIAEVRCMPYNSKNEFIEDFKKYMYEGK